MSEQGFTKAQMEQMKRGRRKILRELRVAAAPLKRARAEYKAAHPRASLKRLLADFDAGKLPFQTVGRA